MSNLLGVIDPPAQALPAIELVSPGTRTVRTSDGFILHDPLEETSVRVIAHPLCFETISEVRPELNQRIGLFEYRWLVHTIALGLTAQWHPRGEVPPRWLLGWKVARTRRAVGKSVHAEWRRLLEPIDPVVLQVQRSLFAAMCLVPDVAFNVELYKRTRLVEDIVRYRACALTVRNAEALVLQAERNRFERSSELAAARIGAQASGLQIAVTPQPPYRLPLEQTLEALDDWVGLLSSTGRGYPNLYETLKRMPGGMPAGIVRALPLVHLSRPITARLELLALLFAAEAENRRWMEHARHSNVFMRARTGEIKRGMALASRFNHQELRPRKAMDVQEFVRFVCDYPGEHTGSVVGLTRKSIAWHRDDQAQAQVRALGGLDPETETARPPIDVPTQPEIRFLAKVQDVIDEGAHMGHCVASYAGGAVHGEHYLFHVEHGGEEATVQVNWHGGVVQAQGPRNHPSNAASWGRRVLATWGSRFPEDPPAPSIHAAPPIYPAPRFEGDLAF